MRWTACLLAAATSGCFLFHSPEEAAEVDGGAHDAGRVDAVPLPDLDCEDPSLWTREPDAPLDVFGSIGGCGVRPNHPVWYASVSSRLEGLTPADWYALSPPVCWRVVSAEPGSGLTVGDTHRSDVPHASLLVHGHGASVVVEGRTLLADGRLYAGRTGEMLVEPPRPLFEGIAHVIAVFTSREPLVLTARGLESPAEVLLPAAGAVLSGAELTGRPAWLERGTDDAVTLRVADASGPVRITHEIGLGRWTGDAQLFGTIDQAVTLRGDQLLIARLDTGEVRSLGLEGRPDQAAHWDDLMVLRHGTRVTALRLSDGRELPVELGEVDRLVRKAYLPYESLPLAVQRGLGIDLLTLVDDTIRAREDGSILLTAEEDSLLGAPLFVGGEGHQHVWGETGFVLGVALSWGTRGRATDMGYGGSTVFVDTLGPFNGERFAVQRGDVFDVHYVFSVGPCE